MREQYLQHINGIIITLNDVITLKVTKRQYKKTPGYNIRREIHQCAMRTKK